MSDDVRQLTIALCGVHNAIVDYISTYQNHPTINSRAITELGDSRYHKAIANAYSQSGVQLLMACDQLIALSRTFAEPTLTVAPWTCVRAILELTAVASWLVDPKIGVKERAERSYALRFEGVCQQKMFVDAAGEDAAPAVMAIQNLEAEAAGIGLTILRDNKGKLTGIGEHWKSFTWLIKTMLDEEANYRLYSAMTHGHLWAATQLGFSGDTAGTSSPLAVSNALPIIKTMPPIAAPLLCMIAAKNVIQFVDYKAQLFGWDKRPLAEAVAPHLAMIAAMRKGSPNNPAAPST